MNENDLNLNRAICAEFTDDTFKTTFKTNNASIYNNPNCSRYGFKG